MRFMALALATFMGCQPRFIETTSEIDGYLARSDFGAACVAMKMEDDSLRGFAASRLAKFPESEVATDCVCAALYDADEGTWDEASAVALKGSRRDDLASCLGKAVADSRVTDRAPLVAALGGIMAPGGYAALATLASDEKDPVVRAMAISGLQPSLEHADLIVARLAADEAPEVRVAAALALRGTQHDGARKALLGSLKGDADGTVRAAAAKILALEHTRSIDEALCTALMDDADPGVRYNVAKSFHNPQKGRQIDCLRRRLLTKEEDASVRQATYESLGASPRDEAKAALCQAIGPFVRMYVVKEIQDKIPGTEIIKAQNNQDWETSFACVSKALSQGGYSCYARHHLGVWMNDLGGKASTPWCPGMVKL